MIEGCFFDDSVPAPIEEAHCWELSDMGATALTNAPNYPGNDTSKVVISVSLFSPIVIRLVER